MRTIIFWKDGTWQYLDDLPALVYQGAGHLLRVRADLPGSAIDAMVNLRCGRLGQKTLDNPR